MEDIAQKHLDRLVFTPPTFLTADPLSGTSRGPGLINMPSGLPRLGSCLPTNDDVQNC